jgi:hypothetical protein
MSLQVALQQQKVLPSLLVLRSAIVVVALLSGALRARIPTSAQHTKLSTVDRRLAPTVGAIAALLVVLLAHPLSMSWSDLAVPPTTLNRGEDTIPTPLRNINFSRIAQRLSQKRAL